MKKKIKGKGKVKIKCLEKLKGNKKIFFLNKYQNVKHLKKVKRLNKGEQIKNEKRGDTQIAKKLEIQKEKNTADHIKQQKQVQVKKIKE